MRSRPEVKFHLLNYLTTLNNWTTVRSTGVGTFKCGAFNLSTDNVGTKMTVELHPLRADDDDAGGDRDSSTWVEGVNTFVVAASRRRTFADTRFWRFRPPSPAPWNGHACAMHTGTASAESGDYSGRTIW